jgi:hypothetical protein
MTIPALLQGIACPSAFSSREVAIARLPSTPIGRAAAQEVWSIQNNSDPTIGLLAVLMAG